MKDEIMKEKLNNLSEQQMEWINKYCENDMSELKKMSYNAFYRYGIPFHEYDDLYSDAMNVLLESVLTFDLSKKTSFKTYLENNIKRSTIDWYRNNYQRAIRKNLMTGKNGKIVKFDKNGNISKDGNGTPKVVHDVSFDAPTEDASNLKEKIASNFNIESESSIFDVEEDGEENVTKFLNGLSNKQRKILLLKMRNFTVEEILENLRISKKEYDAEMRSIRMDENLSLFAKNINDCNCKEDKTMERVIEMTEAEGYRTDKNTLFSLLDQKKNGDINCTYILQRKPFQWTTEERNRYICRILSNLPIPEIVLCEQNIKGLTIAHLIDGLQRLSYAEAFKENRFKIGANGAERHLIQYRDFKVDENGRRILDEDGIPVFEVKVFDVVNKKYKDLPDELKKRFNDFNVNVTKFFNCTDEQIADQIRDYNNHASMNNEQSGITRISTETAKRIKTITEKSGFFKNCGKFTQANKTKGKLDRVVAEIAMLLFHKDDWKAKVKATYKYLDENSSQEEFDVVAADLDKLESIVEDAGKEVNEMFTTTYTPMWTAVFHKFLTYNKELHSFIDFLNAYNNGLKDTEIDGVSMDDFKDQQSKKKATITGKVELLVKLMENFLGIDSKENKEDEDSVVEVEEAEVTKDNEVITETSNVETEDLTPIEFVRQVEKSDVTEEDMEDYESYIEDTVRISSPIYQQCKLALLTMAAYVYDKEQDEEFADWIEQYANDVYTFSKDQKVNYDQIKSAFLRDLQKKGVA